MAIMKKKSERMKMQSETGLIPSGECPDIKDAVAVSTDGAAAPPVYVRLCVDILIPQHRKLKVYAAQQGITLNELVERLADRLGES